VKRRRSLNVENSEEDRTQESGGEDDRKKRISWEGSRVIL
jgi:hypothetical protein